MVANNIVVCRCKVCAQSMILFCTSTFTALLINGAAVVSGFPPPLQKEGRSHFSLIRNGDTTNSQAAPQYVHE
jgi:hypothetical protein